MISKLQRSFPIWCRAANSEVTLELSYPMLRGLSATFLRFSGCEEDLSHKPPDAPFQTPVASGKEPFIVIGAIAGRMIMRLKKWW